MICGVRERERENYQILQQLSENKKRRFLKLSRIRKTDWNINESNSCQLPSVFKQNTGREFENCITKLLSNKTISRFQIELTRDETVKIIMIMKNIKTFCFLIFFFSLQNNLLTSTCQRNS